MKEYRFIVFGNREKKSLTVPVFEEGATGRGEPPLLVVSSSETGIIISIFSVSEEAKLLAKSG